MKKLLLTIFIVAIGLSGCAAKTDYEQLVKEASEIKNAEVIDIEIGATIGDSEVNYTVSTDLKNDLVKLNILNQEIYVQDGVAYVQVMGTWLKSTLDSGVASDLEDILESNYIKLDFPDGDATLGSNPTGIEQIDNLITGKKLNDIVVATKSNEYTLTSLEDLVTVDTSNGLKLSANVADISGHISYSKGETLTLPKETADATEVPSFE